MPFVKHGGFMRPESGGRVGRNGLAYTYGSSGTSPWQAPGATYPITADAGNEKWVFGFWSVKGAANGDYIVLTESISIDIGTIDVVAKAWYVLRNPPSTQSAVFVDAYDLDAGAFFDEPFAAVVDVKYVADPALTAAANNDGLVSTAQMHFVKADESVLAKGAETSYLFNRWEAIAGTPDPIAGALLATMKGVTSQAVAFYTRLVPKRPSPPLRPTTVPAAGTWVSWGVSVDGGGPTGGGPVGPGPMMAAVAAGVALAELADKLDRTVRADVLKIASRQIALAADRLQKAIEGRATS